MTAVGLRRYVLWVGLMMMTACGGAISESENGAPPQEVSEPTATITSDDEAGGVSATATYGCCALCVGRNRYHLVAGVVSHCTERARDYCSVGTREGLDDAAWGYCDP